MSLRAAIKTFIETGGDRTQMLIPLWALTYNCEPDAVRLEWERQMTAKSQEPINQYDETGEGK